MSRRTVIENFAENTRSSINERVWKQGVTVVFAENEDVLDGGQHYRERCRHLIRFTCRTIEVFQEGGTFFKGDTKVSGSVWMKVAQQAIACRYNQ